MNVDPMEILNELSVTAPLELERAALRVTNRKLLARVAELETDNPPENPHEQSQAQYNPGAGVT